MSDQTIASRIIEVIADHLGVVPAEVTPTTDFEKDLGADSLDVVELVMAFEEEFDIEINDEIGHKFRNLQDVVDCVTALLDTDGQR